jgi:hypothetical protein
VIGEGLAKAGAIKAKMTQQAPNLAKLQQTLGLSSKQLAAYYFYEEFDVSQFGYSNVNMGMPSNVQCLFDPTKC